MSVDGLWLYGVRILAVRVVDERTRPKDVGGGSDEAVIRRCWTRWRDSGEGLGEERALRLAMLGESEVVDDVLRDCVDIVLNGERVRNWRLLAVGDDEQDVREACKGG